MSHLLPMTCTPLVSQYRDIKTGPKCSVLFKLVCSTLPQVKQRTGIIIRTADFL